MLRRGTAASKLQVVKLNWSQFEYAHAACPDEDPRVILGHLDPFRRAWGWAHARYMQATRLHTKTAREIINYVDLI